MNSPDASPDSALPAARGTLDAPLREDVRHLGATVGELLTEQLGEDAFHRVEAIRTQAAILADPERTHAERLQALKFVVHFVGDVHQPLHAGYAHDKGGNDVQVNFDGQGTNLHTLWDSRMLVSTGRGEQAYLAHLRTLPRPALAAMVLPPPTAVWAEQSCRVVTRPDFYPRRAKLEQAYVDKHLPIAERQLRAGGVALAAVLNKALGGR